jgi:hypothetical protein
VNASLIESGAVGLDTGQARALLSGDPRVLRGWSEDWHAGRVALCTGVVLVGAGLYGAAMGWWRAPLAGLYVAIKFPLIILLTTVGNAMLNSMLAPLLGLNASFRQSFLAILMSFTIASAILGALCPLVGFLVWNAPPMTPDAARSVGTYSFIQVIHVVIIAFAGAVANWRLVQLLREWSGNRAIARRVLVAWLAGNLFLGSQLCWILRPFIGSPNLPVEFLRATAFRGNFYETIFRALLRLANVD